MFKFSSTGFPELACGQFNPVHGVHTRDTSKNSLILIPRMLASQYCNNSLRGDRASLQNKISSFEVLLSLEFICYEMIPTSSQK